MTSRALPTWIFGAGLAAVIGAVFWSLEVYSEVGQRIISKGFRPNNLIGCLYTSSGNCALLGEAAAQRGVTPYSPVLFWGGLALMVLAVVLVYRLPALRAGDDASAPLLRAIDTISTGVGQVFAWCILLLTFAVSYEVFSRYVLGSPTAWAFDASYILYGALFIMAGPYALARNAHVRGDFLYREWPVKRQASMDLALYFLFFFPGIIAFIYSGYGFAAQSWMTHEHSAYSPDGLPVFQYKTLIPVTGILLLVQGIAEVIRCILAIRTGAWPRRLHDVEELEKIILEQHQPKGEAA